MSKNIKESARYLALELLLKIHRQKTYSNIGLNQILKKYSLLPQDERLLTNLVYGVLQHRMTLEYWLEPFIKEAKQVDDWVYELLLLAIYQLKYLDKIPMHAIFNETIEISKIKGHGGTRKFVTGILHAIQRKGLRNFNDLPFQKRLSIEYSVPVWIVKALINATGEEKTAKMLAVINDKPHDSLRTNIAKIDRDALQLKLVKEKINTIKSPITVEGLIAEKGFLAGTPAFKQGDFIIQDESAILVEESMGVKPGQQILDACSAPGCKTTQIAAVLHHQGQVMALDIHENKLRLVRKNAKRLGVADVIKTQALDARKVNEEFKANTFDQILVDAPCSGIGLIRRKPEIKYEKTLQDSLNLAKVQLAILDSVAVCLKHGGKLTYSTCTILNTENQTVIDRFLKIHPEFKQVKTITTKNLKSQRQELGLTIYPDDYGSDGFFIATLIKE